MASYQIRHKVNNFLLYPDFLNFKQPIFIFPNYDS